jgi:oxygen-dependent protoporphyrinogen oxidase
VPNRFDVVIVGGGISGLVAARKAAQQGQSVCLIEASDRFGGAIQGQRLGGVTVDVGAEAFAIARPETLNLIQELGLGDRVVAPRRSDSRLIVPQGTFPMPHALLGIPTNPLADDVVAIIGIDEATKAAQLDELPVPDSWDPQITLGALIRQRLGDQITDYIATPVVGGVHALHPDLAEAEAIMPGITAATTKHGGLSKAAAAIRASSGVPGAAVNGLVGGMSNLVDALVQELQEAPNVELILSSPVNNIGKNASAGQNGWEVTTATQTFVGDHVVVALDAKNAARVLTSVPAIQQPLSRLHVGDVVVFAALITSDVLDEDPLGSGALIAPSTPNVHAKAITHASAKWEWVRTAFGPSRHVVRLSYGRDGVINENLDDLAVIAHADLEILLGTSMPAFDETHLARWTGSLLHPRVGHRANVAELKAAAATIEGLSLAIAGLAGNGLAGTVSQAHAAIS